VHRHRIKISIVLFLVMLLSTGCWDSADIEHKDITTAVLIDKTETGYAFYAEIASLVGGGTGESSQGSMPRSQVIHGGGATFVEAREALERQSDQRIYLASVQNVIFTETILYSGIEHYLYRFRQNPEYRKRAMVAATGEKPEDLFSAASEHNTLVGLAINDTIESLVDTGQLYHFTMGDVLEALACPCKGYLIPRVSLVGQDVAADGYCVMYGGICKGYIPIDEGKFIVYVQGKAPPFHYAIPYEENSITVEIRLKKNPTKVDYRDGQIKFCLDMVCQADLLYMKDDFAMDAAAMEEIEEKLERQLTAEFRNIVHASQKVYGVDYLRFHEAFHIHYPDEYKQVDWKAAYPEAEIAVDVAVELGGGNIDYEPEA